MKTFPERLLKVSDITDRVHKVVVEMETTPDKNKTPQLRGEYRDGLLQLVRIYRNMSDEMLNRVEDMKQ